ncbi:MAG TPA: hypothetical protein VNO30_40970 [Kofleriaceae bacterium]|nr:hypothetical protein [Kofleriaceae bacterium]
MVKTFGATFSGPDMTGLTAALIDAAPYARGMPTGMRHNLVPEPPVADWRERMLASDVDGLAVQWGDYEQISREPGAIGAHFPDVPIDAQQVLAFVAPLPFEVAVMPPIRTWLDDYFAPAIGADHALLGWGMIFKGAGHERAVTSRRWLEHGPFRTLKGPHDTTLVQFHDLAADVPTSRAQAQPGHEWMVAGFLRPKHRYQHDIAGVYTYEDRLLRVMANDRPVDDQELLDACAARRDCRDRPDRPVRNIAYIFFDPAEAQARLDALWLRELECRLVGPSGERRLDDEHRLTLAKPAWVE